MRMRMMEMATNMSMRVIEISMMRVIQKKSESEIGKHEVNKFR